MDVNGLFHPYKHVVCPSLNPPVESEILNLKKPSKTDLNGLKFENGLEDSGMFFSALIAIQVYVSYGWSTYPP